ncbi:transglutaminase [Geobacillus subterraneus]|uniref:Transglutaminase n=2 Tax=Geobacillus TaxID=129337 RepID=A0ABM6AEG4_9BACL|nr:MULTISPECIES: transglutaminaseTgpA domain-containing protein [Geobacillus]AMX84733.1 transglutaminase [Geobacillus subterraneus]KZS25641.1 transglutaminase [Geobacillus subterraneus]OXB85558.1 transglutaminase [Geobacillus uzenensis]QIZ66444.1 DUF4129 domain-containing protein [Geobacillus subterraneus]WPZ18647.1 transglutaminaseTgpA domain-containing protein [Geobacillus subterraneus]
MKQKAENMVSAALPNVLAAWLLTEWLWPLGTVTDTAHIGTFAIFVVICFLFYALRVPIWLSVLGKISFIWRALSEWFDDQSIPNIVRTFWDSGAAWLVGDRPSSMPDAAVRTLAFFVLLWAASFVWHWLIVRRNRWFVPYALTVGYIAVLDTFFPYSGNKAVVRLVALGFFAFAWLHGERLRAKGRDFHIGKWRAAALSIPAIAVAAGYIGPKLPPQWPDPVAFIHSYAADSREELDTEGTTSVKKIGYGQNDSRLGGPFIADDTVVFMAKDEGRHYWRVETKDVYTGKGWEVFQSEQVQSFRNGMPMEYEWWSEKVNATEQTAEITRQDQAFHLVYPLGLQQVQTSDHIVYRMHMATEKIYTTDVNANALPVRRYMLTYMEPDFPIEALRAAPPVQDAAFLKRYTQLPDTLPRRVRDLARQITEGKETVYDQVKAIEQYFHMNGYAYETTDVAVPGANQDYVDQFLFETKQGYCDNFSTSMVVLVRSLGIPARWVKGYTSGRWVGEQNGAGLYEVRNNDAHSWVEVYFEGVGWVPFEPTQGFVNPYAFSLPASNEEQQAPPLQPEQQETPRVPLEQLIEPSSPEQDPHWWEKLAGIWSWKAVLSVFAMLAAWGGTIYATRRKWWPRLTLLRFRRRQVDGSEWLVPAYLALLRQLHDYGLRRKEDETLRQYAIQVDRLFETDEMERLTKSYEQAIYGANSSRIDIREARQLWENLIKRTIS